MLLPIALSISKKTFILFIFKNDFHITRQLIPPVHHFIPVACIFFRLIQLLPVANIFQLKINMILHQIPCETKFSYSYRCHISPLPLNSSWRFICEVWTAWHLPPIILSLYICQVCATLHFVEFLFSSSITNNKLLWTHLLFIPFALLLILVFPPLFLARTKIIIGNQDEKLHTPTNNKHFLKNQQSNMM